MFSKHAADNKNIYISRVTGVKLTTEFQIFKHTDVMVIF